MVTRVPRTVAGTLTLTLLVTASSSVAQTRDDDEGPRRSPSAPTEISPVSPPSAAFPIDDNPYEEPSPAPPAAQPAPTPYVPPSAPSAPYPAQPYPAQPYPAQPGWSTAPLPPARDPWAVAPGQPYGAEQNPYAEPAQGDDEPERPVRLGVVFGVGLPNLLSFGAVMKLTRYAAVGINVGTIPKTTISVYGEAELTYMEYDFFGRIHPLGGAFFFGAGLGYATVEGTHTEVYDLRRYQYLDSRIPAEAEIVSDGYVRATVFSPQLGWLHTFGSGFSLGFDFGLQVPLSASRIEYRTRIPEGVPTEFVQTYVAPNDQKVEDTIERLARTPLPFANLRIGWLF